MSRGSMGEGGSFALCVFSWPCVPCEAGPGEDEPAIVPYNSNAWQVERALAVPIGHKPADGQGRPAGQGHHDGASAGTGGAQDCASRREPDQPVPERGGLFGAQAPAYRAVRIRRDR